MAPTVAPEMQALSESVYSFLMKNGHEATAKSFVKEAKLDAKALKKSTATDLSEIFSSSLKRPIAAVESDSDSDDDSEVEAPPAKKAAPAVKAAAPVAKKADSSSDDDSSEDEAPVKKAAPVVKKAAVESSSDDSDDSEEEAPVKKAPVVVAKVAAKKPVESSSDDDSSEDEAPVKKAAPAAKATPAKKAAVESSSDDSDDDSEEEAPAKKAPVKATPAKVAAKEESSSDEDSDEEEAPVVVKKTNKAAPEVVAATAPVYDSASTTMGLHKIYVKGLPWLASEAEVKDFFKACGKISSVELPMGDDGRSTGTAFVIFNERSELDKAIELDGQYWPGTERWLKIQEGFEKPERKSFGTGVRPEGCDTVFVGNLPFDVEEDQLKEVFAEAGQVDRIRFATAEDGSFKGFAHVQFADGASTDEAVKMAGTDINGRSIRVDYAPPRDRQSAGGGASGGRGGRGDGGRGGRGGRDGGRGGGRGRGTPGSAPGGNKTKGSIAVSAGKKMTFDE